MNTKDANSINADNLFNYDVVVFYTTGDLTQNSSDGVSALNYNNSNNKHQL